ncbi:S-layer homology domain-containing protein [Paenibacillus radicis (ex Gao et al. 2016)]|uniref:SLH domain-containing protein n=1 Tax=Paenibacillus radicis (ex Gao et al. 2016) TaxID=1737354 RepID=A0A917LYT4_9BACL|nr:S-layer homology domain-containing protein [Paenibacillus radicis (ex Gao et al. 2016)]GGG66008.1 hypothetical protein GCM10010918_20450 [Paenibacillus radicis (ex Gao et al. 2016)]
MKKSLFLVLVLSLALFYPLHSSSIEAAEANPLDLYNPTDIEGHWANAQLENFVSADLLKGYTDPKGNMTLQPEAPVTRAEFTAMLVRVLDLKSEDNSVTFADVQPGSWYAEPIRVAAALNIANGVGGNRFGPNQIITRGEMTVLVVRAFQSSISFEGKAVDFSDVPNYFARPFIQQASQAGIIQGSSVSMFRPFTNAKRAEAVVMLQRALDLQKGALPQDSQLTQPVLDSEEQELQIFKDKNFDQLDDAFAKFYTGYYLTISNAYASDVVKWTKQGYGLKMEKAVEQKLRVLQKTDRFAAVESTGGSYKITMTDGDNQSVETQSNEGVYLLKKMTGDAWKIYAFYTSESANPGS